MPTKEACRALYEVLAGEKFIVLATSLPTAAEQIPPMRLYILI